MIASIGALVVGVGGIGEVATKPAARRSGLAEAVLCDVAAFIDAQGLALSMLHSSNLSLQVIVTCSAIF